MILRYSSIQHMQRTISYILTVTLLSLAITTQAQIFNTKKNKDADELYTEAVQATRAGQYQKAIALSRQALEVRPEYVRDLKSEALVLTEIEDAIACKALGVDGAYVRGLAAAGYRKLSADEVVSMKAMGVTGAYAQAMNRAAGGISK